MFHVPWQEGNPSYLLDPGSMVMELLPLQWSTLSTSEIPLDAPVPAWAGHVPGHEDWLERVVCEGGVEDTDVAQNRLNRDVIVLGSGSNQNTFLVSDAQPCPWRSLQICLIFSNGEWNVHMDLKKLVVWSHWMIGKRDSYCFNEFLIQLWCILLHVLSYIYPTFTMNNKQPSICVLLRLARPMSYWWPHAEVFAATAWVMWCAL